MSEKKAFIEVDPIIERLCNLLTVYVPELSEKTNLSINQGISAALIVIKDARPADVKPIVRGEWEDEAPEYDKKIAGRHRFKCSVCGKEPDYFTGGYGDWWCCIAPNYCPNCGADMRGGRNEY